MPGVDRTRDYHPRSPSSLLLTFVPFQALTYGMRAKPNPYPSDVTDAEWTSLLPYLTLMREDAPQRQHDLRNVFNAARYVVKTGCHWRYLPHAFPPGTVVYQQVRRWLDAGVFKRIAHDLREITRLLEDRSAQPKTASFDGRVSQSTLESGGRHVCRESAVTSGRKVRKCIWPSIP